MNRPRFRPFRFGAMFHIRVGQKTIKQHFVTLIGLAVIFEKSENIKKIPPNLEHTLKFSRPVDPRRCSMPAGFPNSPNEDRRRA